MADPYTVKPFTSAVDNGRQIPAALKLDQNYPNPFNQQTTINYTIPVGAHIQLKVFDIHGREIACLVDQFQLPGNYSVSINSKGVPLPAGIYYCRISAGYKSSSIKMISLR